MTWTDIKRKIIKECGEVLVGTPYRFVPSRNAYELPSSDENRSINIGLTASNRGNRWMSIWCSMRNNAIEESYLRALCIEKADINYYHTVSLKGLQLVQINTDWEIEDAIREAKRFITTKGLQFLSKQYTLSDLSEMLNANPDEALCPYHPNPQSCRLHGLIVAKLSKDSRYEELKVNYERFMRDSNKGFFYPQFQRVVADLESLGTQI